MESVVLKPKRCVYLVKSEIAHNFAPGSDIVVCALEMMLHCVGIDKKGVPKMWYLLFAQWKTFEKWFFFSSSYPSIFSCCCVSSELQNVVGIAQSGCVVTLVLSAIAMSSNRNYFVPCSPILPCLLCMQGMLFSSLCSCKTQNLTIWN